MAGNGSVGTLDSWDDSWDDGDHVPLLRWFYGEVARYLRQERSLAELEEAVTPYIPTLFSALGDDPRLGLLDELELDLAELDDGILSEDELRERLARAFHEGTRSGI